ncbi:hypothetical protein CR513_47370, partial [Mucuna pruriens]
MEEKEMMVSTPLPIEYVEGDEEALETSFKALEIVGTTSAEGVKGIPIPSKATIMAAKILINNDFEPDTKVSSQISNATFTSDDACKPSRQEEEEETEEETLRELKSEGKGVKEIRVGKQIPPAVKQGLTELLWEYADILRDMPELDTTIVKHKLPLNLDAILVRQQLRRMKPKVTLKIKEEVEKQWNASFLAVAEYP